MNEPLDQRLRRDLGGTAPANIHERVQSHFSKLAERLRTGRPASSPHRHRGWWWSLAGAFGAAGLALLLVLSWPTRLQAKVEFVGILAMDNSTRFYLSDPEEGTSSGWISLQDRFAGYTLTDYDPSGDVLTLNRDGEETRIALRDAPIASARIEIQGTLTFTAGGSEPLRIDRATFLLGQENTLPLRDGARLVVTPTIVPEGGEIPPGLHYRFVHELPDADGTFQVAHDIEVVVLPGKQFGLLIGKGLDDPKGIRLNFEPVN